MQTEQVTFDFESPAVPGEVEALVTYLRKQGNAWTSAKQIQAALGINDRKLRILRAAAKSRILSAPGTPGYRHIDFATLDEIHEVAARKHSQIRAMVADYIDLKRVAHSRLPR